MRRFFIISLSVTLSSVLFLCYTSVPGAEESELLGVWVRKSDNLRIKVVEVNDVQLSSHIVEEGNEKFPCDVTQLPIYKNIRRIKGNLWSCDFLVVTLGSCATQYDEGIIRIMKDGSMEITCPGFDKKIYSKLKPRYEL